MNEVLETFIVRTSYFSKLEKMSDEQLGKLFRAIFGYVLSNGEASAEFDDVLTEMAYGFITDQIGKDMKRYHQTSESRRKSALEREAKKRERKRGKTSEPQTSTSKPQTSTSKPQTSTSEPQTSTSEPQTSTSEPQTSTSVTTNEHKRHSNNNNIRLSKDNHCNNNNKDSFIKESKSTLSNAREERFEIWWNLYDKKVEREKARNEWLALSDEDQQKCIDIAPRYVKAEPDKKFRKNPLTYLIGECWNDEIIEHKRLNTNDYDRLKERRGSPAPGHTEEEYRRGNTWEACV